MDPRKFIMGSSQPGFSFIRPGDRVIGVITDEPETRQMKVWKQGKPSDELAVWPDGSPKWQLVIPLQTQFRNWEGIREPDRSVPDDGRRNVYVNGKHREAALKQAIRSAGVDWLEVGGIYDETYLGDDYESKAGIKPKLGKISYTPPARSAVPDDGYSYSPAGQQNWQQPGWTPQQAHHEAMQQARVQEFSQPAAVPSHHGQPAAMPEWATADAPQSAPPAPVSPAGPALSTLEQLRAQRNAPVGSDSIPY